MAGTRISRLNFDYGIEDVTPIGPSDRASLPSGGALQPTNDAPISKVEEIVGAQSFASAIEDFIRPRPADMGVCRPDRFAGLLAESREVLGKVRDGGGDEAGAAGDLVDVLDRQEGLRDLLSYYVQSLVSA